MNKKVLKILQAVKAAMDEDKDVGVWYAFDEKVAPVMFPDLYEAESLLTKARSDIDKALELAAQN